MLSPRSGFSACCDERVGIGAPKDANLYQASRGATYVLLAAHNPLRDGGRDVVPGELSEGTGERRFHEWLSGADDAESLYEAMRAGYEPGAQRVFVLASALRDHEVWITNSDHPELVEDCLMYHTDRPEDAVAADDRVLVVPDAIDTLLG